MAGVALWFPLILALITVCQSHVISEAYGGLVGTACCGMGRDHPEEKDMRTLGLINCLGRLLASLGTS